MPPKPTKTEENIKSGYVKVFRSVKEHWLWEPRRKRTKLEAFLDLLLRAQYNTIDDVVGYDKIELKRGQILTSQEGLARDWKWDRSAVRLFLSSLHRDQILASETTSKYTIITICNYDSYQGELPTKPQQNQHQTNTTSTHTNKVKKDKNIILLAEANSIVGLPEATQPPGEDKLSFESKCTLFIEKFNSIKLIGGKPSKYQVTDVVRTKLKARMKNYRASDILHGLRLAMKDQHHIEQNFLYITPEFILRENILERYLNATIDNQNNEELTYTQPKPTINHQKL